VTLSATVHPNKRIFIVGASSLQLPAIRKAKSMGLRVGVADFNPEAVGVEYADEYFNVSTNDECGIYQAAKAFRADGVLTLATDRPIRAAAYATDKLGLPGISYETAIRATDKEEMIRAFEAHDVAHPWFHVVDKCVCSATTGSEIAYPCVSKPVDGSGSRGVVLINHADELGEAIRYSATYGYDKRVIIEQFLEGTEVSVEVFVVDRVPQILAVTDKITTGRPHFVEVGHSQPSRIDLADLRAIEDLAARACLAVGIDQGPAHVEIMLTKEGPKMIELGARLGGDYIATHLVPLSTGIDVVGAVIVLALGGQPDLEPKHNRGAAIRYFSVQPGILKRIEGVEEAQLKEGVEEISTFKRVGDAITELRSSSDRVGMVIAHGDSPTQALKSCEAALEGIVIVVERNDSN